MKEYSMTKLNVSPNSLNHAKYAPITIKDQNNSITKIISKQGCSRTHQVHDVGMYSLGFLL